MSEASADLFYDLGFVAGSGAERERIIKLIQEQMIQCSHRDWLIELIEGDSN